MSLRPKFDEEKENAIIEECHSLGIAWIGQFSEDTPTGLHTVGSHALYNTHSKKFYVALLNLEPRPWAGSGGSGDTILQAFANAAKEWNSGVSKGYWSCHWVGPSDHYWKVRNEG